jgi:tRNA A-37 threonylcarbamoyl transferase component Bud32
LFLECASGRSRENYKEFMTAQEQRDRDRGGKRPDRDSPADDDLEAFLTAREAEEFMTARERSDNGKWQRSESAESPPHIEALWALKEVMEDMEPDTQSTASTTPGPSTERSVREGLESEPPMVHVISISKAELLRRLKGHTLTVDDLDVSAEVGRGAFSRVYLAKMKGIPEAGPMALKLSLRRDINTPRRAAMARNEVQILKQVEHPSLVRLMLHFQDKKHNCVLMEFVNGGDLQGRLWREGSLPVADCRFYVGEIVLALAFLHSKYIVYRDLKPENLLFTCQGHIKVIDFGFAKLIRADTWTVCGTPEYCAPEIILASGHGRWVDWWSVGVLTFELLAGHRPFRGDSVKAIFEQVLKGHVDCPSHFEASACGFIGELLEKDRDKRLGCSKNGVEDIQRHRWFGDTDFEALLSRAVPPPYVPGVEGPDDVSLTPLAGLGGTTAARR